MNSDFETPFGMVVVSSTLIIAVWFIFAELAVPAHAGHLFSGLFSREKTHGRALSPRTHLLSPIDAAAACPRGVEAQGGAHQTFSNFSQKFDSLALRTLLPSVIARSDTRIMVESLRVDPAGVRSPAVQFVEHAYCSDCAPGTDPCCIPTTVSVIGEPEERRTTSEDVGR